MSNFAPSDLTPDNRFSHISTVKNDGITEYDLLHAYVMSQVEQDGITGHSLVGYNELISEKLEYITSYMFDYEKQIRNDVKGNSAKKGIDSFKCGLKFNNLVVHPPSTNIDRTTTSIDLLPNQALNRSKNYSGDITIDIEVYVIAVYENGATEKQSGKINNIKIGEFPIMIRSEKCHLSRLSDKAIRDLQEDVFDNGGHFILGGEEHVVMLRENIAYNTPHYHKAMKKNEWVRVQYISQPNDAYENSAQTVLRIMSNGQLTIEISSTTYEATRIPFFVIFGLFGMTDDREILKTIAFDPDSKDPIIQTITKHVAKAFHNADDDYKNLITERNRSSLVKAIIAKLRKDKLNNKYEDDPNAVAYITEELLGSEAKPGGLDVMLFPHLGRDHTSRIRKLRFIGFLFHRMYKVHYDILPPTDRDSYTTKRVHGAGVSLAKLFKTHFKASIISKLVKAVRDLIEKTDDWKKIQPDSLTAIASKVLSNSKLGDDIKTAIISSNKTTVIGKTTNRVSAQIMERKNPLNAISTARQIVTPDSSTQASSERSDKLRRVHATYLGFVCLFQTAPTGESVGKRKQLACTATVCNADDATFLKQWLALDKEITRIDDVDSVLFLDDTVSIVFVNGEPIGICRNGSDLCDRYRALRRNGRVVQKHSTIALDIGTGDIKFELDVGRLRRPLLIVDNNYEEYKKNRQDRKKYIDKHGSDKGAPPLIDFIQNVRLTKEHLTNLNLKKISLDDLVSMGIVEYITPAESENCYVAENISNLRLHKNDPTNIFTHCDTSQAIAGFPALVSPFANHTQPARVSYETGQARQAGGWYANNAPYRMDQNKFFQYYVEHPLVETITNKLTPANGSNLIVAYICSGDNQEDSAEISKTSSDRSMLCGAFYKTEYIELEQSQSFAPLDKTNTTAIKTNANYSKLAKNGIIKKGYVVYTGDILAGRRTTLTTPTADGALYADNSITYSSDEPAVVDNVIMEQPSSGPHYVMIKLRYERRLGVGDKVSTRSGNKSIVATEIQQSDMPYTLTGLTPDLLINPHSLPTRMTIGQVIETRTSILCATKGFTADGTAFLPVDHKKIEKDLIAAGFRANGCQTMFDGRTGEYFDAAIFIGPTYEQRLLKFVLDDKQAVGGTGPTDAITGQARPGKHIKGGLRFGEMDGWTGAAHGSVASIGEKMHTDSDGRVMHICRNCGVQAVKNDHEEIYNCNTCGDYANIETIESDKSSMFFQNSLAGANIGLKYNLAPFKFEKRL